MNELTLSHPIHVDFGNILSSVEDLIFDMIIWILWKIVKVMNLITRARYKLGDILKLISFIILFSLINISLITGCTSYNQGNDNTTDLHSINYSKDVDALTCTSNTQGNSQKSFLDHLFPNRGVIAIPSIPHGN